MNIECKWCGFSFLGDGDEIACPICGRNLNLNFLQEEIDLEDDSD